MIATDIAPIIMSEIIIGVYRGYQLRRLALYRGRDRLTRQD